MEVDDAVSQQQFLPELPAVVDAGPEIEQFANALDDCLSPRLSDGDRRERLLHLSSRYHENAIRRLMRSKPAEGRSSYDDADMDTDDASATGPLSPGDSEKLKQLEKEAQTWDLLRRVLPLRYPGPEDAAAAPSTSQLSFSRMVDEPPAVVADDNSSLRSFFLTNSIAKERLAVLQWLQTNASSGPDIDDLTRDLQRNADRGDIIADGWLHTRSSVKMKKSVTGWPHLLDRQSTNISATHVTANGEPLVTQLDPDASTRQGRKLQPQDEYFESAICLGCYEHLRRGSSLQTIRDWCQDRTEMWRAVSVSGMLMSADDAEDNVAEGVEPASLALWRRMCFSLAKQGGSNDYERAVYGVLSGDITSVEKVARTWDDFLFVHYNALLRTQLDTFILGRCPPGEASSLTQTFPSFDAVQFHGEEAGVEKRLIRSLESRADIKDEASEANKALQASIISRDIDEYLYNQGRALASSSEISSVLETPKEQKYFALGDNDGLRIVTHLYVLVTLLGRLDEDNVSFAEHLKRPGRRAAQENILAQYAGFLRRARLEELIPVYCSILEPPRRYEVLSANLILEEDSQRRIELLNLMKRANIDVMQFVKTQATLLYEQVAAGTTATFEAKTSFKILDAGAPTARLGQSIQPDFFGDDPDAIEPAHQHLIWSLEWLLMVTETWPNVFSIGTQVYKFFLRHMHLNAARKLAKSVSFAAVMQELGVEDDFDEAWYDNAAFWADQLERNNIQDTTPENVLANARNFRELEALVKALDSLETMGAFADVSKEAPTGQRDFWNQIGDAIKVTKDTMEPLLKNWLLPGIQGGDEELGELRRAYLPETVLAYVSALQFAGTGLSRDWLLECMNLASLVTERGSDLEGAFVESRRVKELLGAFAASSKALAITTSEKRAAGTVNKKLREMGWSRDLWSVKS